MYGAVLALVIVMAHSSYLELLPYSIPSLPGPLALSIYIYMTKIFNIAGMSGRPGKGTGTSDSELLPTQAASGKLVEITGTQAGSGGASW